MKSTRGWNEWEQDRKELKEIAYLYFSEKRSKEAPNTRDTVDSTTVPLRNQSVPLLIHCVEEPELPGLSLFLLSNLAVILRIWSVPVILVGSHARLRRNLFRQDRGIPPLSINAWSTQRVEKFFGPLGIPIHGVKDSLFEKRITQERYHADQADVLQSFRYNGPGFVFADHRDWFFHNITSSSIVIFPVHLNSNEKYFREISFIEKSMGQRPYSHWGITVLGFSTQEKARTFYKEWADRIRDVFRRPVIDCGFLPGDLSREIDFSICSPYVLREPLTYLTRCLQGIAYHLFREKDSVLLPPQPSSSLPLHQDRASNQGI